MRDIAMVAVPGFALADLAALDPFVLANDLPDGPHYRIRILAPEGGAVAGPAGVAVLAETFTEGAAPDTLLVCGGDLFDAPPCALLHLLDAASGRARRTAGVGGGVFLLAAAGLLEGRSVTAHWEHAAELQRRYPGLRVQPDRLCIDDGHLWTSAGMAAGADLALALLEQDLGRAAASAVARRMLAPCPRGGGQARYAQAAGPAPASARIRGALDHARRNLCSALSLDELAAAAGMSRRQFSRRFRLETGQTPARAVEGLRVQAARALIENTDWQVEAIARESGFSDPERMRRAFLRAFGEPPQAIKRMARMLGKPAP